jgi:hypothetical protein
VDYHHYVSFEKLFHATVPGPLSAAEFPSGGDDDLNGGRY